MVMPMEICGERYRRTGDVFRETNYGGVKGFTTENANCFYGIPYAKPPVGKLRWRSPQPRESWSPRILDATELPPSCPQPLCKPGETFMGCIFKVSEDCLYLNIWSPLTANSTSLFPVMLWIHGGHFEYFGISNPLIDGEIFVKKGQVIYVAMNYRLGALGYLITGESGENNFGIMDQSLAMKWVYENIHYFGGDKNKITLFGQSAGAYSTMIHMTKADTQQYFNNAILLSCPFTIPLRTKWEARYLAKIFTKTVGCNYNGFKPDIDCLRSKSAVEIVGAQQTSSSRITSLRFLLLFQPWGPWVDSLVVPQNPLNSLEAGIFFKKPVIIGSVTEEAVFYTYEAFQNQMQRPTYYASLFFALLDPCKMAAAVMTYPTPYLDDLREHFSELATDYAFGCSARYASRLIMSSNARVWMYNFQQAFSTGGMWGRFSYCEGRVCHGVDIPAVFQTSSLSDYEFTNSEVAMSDLIITYFTNFSKFSDPNGLSETRFVTWPVYTQITDWSSMSFRATASNVTKNYRARECDGNDKAGYHSPISSILDILGSGWERVHTEL